MTAAGKTNPCDIYKSVPYRNLPFEEIYDKVCERKGKLKDNVLDLVNPVFPLLRNPTRESLLQNTLFQQKSIKQDRFYYKFDFPFDGSSLLHTSEFIYTLIACCLENYKEPSIVPFFLLFLSDAKQHVIFNEFVDEMLERIGIFIGKNHEEIYGYSECIKRVGGAIEKGFTSICCPQTQLHVKESQKLKRSLMLNKFKTMQQKFNFKDEQSDEEINSSTDSCVICQCITDSSIGRMISLTTNIAVEISREKEGGIVVSPLTISTCNHYIHYACYKEIFDSNKRECPICSKPFSYFVPLSTTIISHNNCLPLVEKDFERIIRKSQNSMNIFMDIIFSTLLGMEITQRHGFSIDPEDMDVVKSFFLAMKIFAPQDTDFEVFFEERKTRFDPLMFFIYAMAYQKDLDQVFLSNVNLIMAILCSSDSRFFSESIIPFMQSYKLKGLDECSTLEEAVQQLSKTFENCIKIFCECTGEIVDIPQVIDYIPRSTGIQFCITVPSVPSALKLIDLPPTFNEFVEIYSGSTCINCKQKIEEFFSIKVCLICGCCICSSPCCLKDHCAECSEGTGILFLSQTGSMCLTSQITRHIVVYENKYGEPFNSDSVQQSTFLLNTSKVEIFKKAFYRGNVFFTPPF
ncbi:E3 ubiquitin-protein ligase [Entamoeba marina]